MVKKVAIVGAEPCGVLMAHYLLKRSDRALNRSFLRCQEPPSALYRVFQGKNLPDRPNQTEHKRARSNCRSRNRRKSNIVDKLLDKYADNWAIAIAQFTIRRKADAHALAKLSDNSYPSSAKLGIEFALKEKLAKTLYQMFPNRFIPSLMNLVFKSSVFYAEILHFYKS